LVRNRVG
jgi:hypothetical protein